MTPFQQKQLNAMRQMEHSHSSGHAVSEIVGIQTDYPNDPQLTLTCVTPLTRQLQRVIQTKLIKPLIAIEPTFYFYPSDALHITIQNIRVIHNPPRFGPSEIAKVQSVLETYAEKQGPFPFDLSGVLSMPTSASVIALVTPEYDQFIKTLRTALADAGVPDDKKYFTQELIFANTTFCRYTRQPSEKFLLELAKHRDETFGTMTAETVSLITTNAGAYPSKTHVYGTYRFAQS